MDACACSKQLNLFLCRGACWVRRCSSGHFEDDDGRAQQRKTDVDLSCPPEVGRTRGRPFLSRPCVRLAARTVCIRYCTSQVRCERSGNGSRLRIQRQTWLPRQSTASQGRHNSPARVPVPRLPPVARRVGRLGRPHRRYRKQVEMPPPPSPGDSFHSRNLRRGRLYRSRLPPSLSRTASTQARRTTSWRHK